MELDEILKYVFARGETYSRTEIFNLISSAVVSGLALADTADTPGAPVNPTTVFAFKIGTYTNYLSAPATPLTIAQNEIGAFSWNPGTGYWTKRSQTISVDLSGYVTGAQLTAAIAALAANFTTSYTYPKVYESYDPAVYVPAWKETTSTFSGWDTAQGVLPTFDRVVFQIRTRATPVTAIWVRIADTNRSGAILGEVHLTGLSIPANTIYTVTADFATPITSANKLRLMYCADQLIDRWGITSADTALPYPIASYAIASYQLSGSLNFATFADTTAGTAMRSDYAQFYLKTAVYSPSAAMITALTAGIPYVSDLPVIRDKSIRSIIYQDKINSATEIYARAAASNPHSGSGVFYGWGFPIGQPTNFNGVMVPIKARSGAAITSIFWELRVGSSTGTLLDSGTLATTIPISTSVDVVFKLAATQVNGSNAKLWFGYKCNQLAEFLGINLGTYFANPAYGMAAYTTSNLGAWNLTSTQENGYAQILVIGNTVNPSTEFTDGIKLALPDILNIAGIKTKQDQALQYDDVINSSAEIFARALASLKFTNSTFSGWGGPMGTPQNYNGVVVPIKARSTAITSIYWELRLNGATGTLIDSGTVAVNVPANTSVDVLFKLLATDVNAGAAQRWFGYKCNQLCDMLGIPTSMVFTSPTYGIANYVTDASTSAAWQVSSSQENPYFKPVVVGQIIAPTPALTSTILTHLGLTLFTPYANIILSSILYAFELGKEVNIYFENIIETNIAYSLLEIDVTCVRGAQFEKFWRYTPQSGDSGNISLTITVTYQGVTLATYTGGIFTAVASSGSGSTRGVILFGASYESGGQQQTAIIAEQSADVFQIAFRGSLGTAPNKHEGRGGWTIADYATAGRTFYIFNVAGISGGPNVSDVYSNNGSQFTVREINISAGTGYFSTEMTAGTNLPTSSGTLTKVSGTGSSSIAYASTSVGSGNPLWNGSAISFSNYLSAKGITMAANDYVGFDLGTNDVFGITDDTTLANTINTMVTQLRAILTNVHTAVAGIRCLIFIPIGPAYNQDGFGVNYGDGQTRKRFQKNIRAWQKRLIAEFDNNTERTAGNILLNAQAVYDAVNNCQTATMAANARNAATITTVTNGLHPAQSGYDQVGDQLRATLKYIG